MREEESTYDFAARSDGEWLGVTVSVANGCGPWHKEGCDNWRVVAPLLKVIRGLGGVARAACIDSGHSSLQLLVQSTGVLSDGALAERIDTVVAAMFEYCRS